MSRSGYSDDVDGWALIRWRGAVRSAIRGKRGQTFLREMLAALDALPEKRLIEEELAHAGEVCAIGAVGKAGNVPMETIHPEDYGAIATAFGISEAMAREIMFMNDEGHRRETPEERFTRMREWIVSQITDAGGKG